MTEPFDLSRATPDGRDTTEYAVDLLRSTHLAEVRAAEHWLTTHPDRARPVLARALATPAAQPAAVLLGSIGICETLDALVAAYRRGGEGLRAAVERGLRLDGSPEALDALALLTSPEEG